MDADALLEKFAAAYAEYDINRVDGVKVDMPEGWVHLRKSNTEPIIRLYAEAGNSRKQSALQPRLNNALMNWLNRYKIHINYYTT